MTPRKPGSFMDISAATDLLPAGEECNSTVVQWPSSDLAGEILLPWMFCNEFIPNLLLIHSKLIPNKTWLSAMYVEYFSRGKENPSIFYSNNAYMGLISGQEDFENHVLQQMKTLNHLKKLSSWTINHGSEHNWMDHPY